ncbi:PucR family transcriptional regulator [Salipaludibacillus daqingensis]|uniref:PucR family transcriptional regulator n=1 Tax=Salipaludibacillus daqingensis TaxID=3041001 RepID=UPI002475FEE9|nr:helix-turn-helix domain-containing protein [Salipaludibacillus daqingensis]
MLDRLQRYYAHAINVDHLHPENRLSLILSNEHKLTLDKRKLTKQEIDLLKTLFHSEDNFVFFGNTQDKLIHDWLIAKKDISQEEIAKTITTPVRFIHFFVSGEVAEHEEFSIAVKGLFPASKSLIWTSKSEGFFIQQIDSEFDDDLPIESIIDTITTDFFINISFYIGSPIPTFSEIPERYHWEDHLYKQVRESFPRKGYFVEQDITIHYLLHSVPEQNLSMITKLLDPVKDDKTLLHSVKTYLECNLNASLAAKKLYMHRNTLQYRVDKFIEKTSMDIKQFPNAVSVYIMLLSH